MEGILQKDILGLGVRMTTAAALAVFLLLGLPLLVSAAERDVVISELMWDGVEYVELVNQTEQEVDLTGWTLTRQQAGGEEKEIIKWEAGDKIGAGEYYLLEKKEEATLVTASKIASQLTLVNTGELVSLKDGSGNIVDQANWLGGWYAGVNNEVGVAMERTQLNSDGLAAASWHTSTGEAGGRLGTPGQANSAPHVNEAPEAQLAGPSAGLVGEQLIFSAEDSTDPEGDNLTYQWTMGDGTTLGGAEVAHVFTQAGTFSVEVMVSDGKLTDKAVIEVKVAEAQYSDKLIINEFLPDPTGDDGEGEFMELKNQGSELVDLASWQLDDKDGGSGAYTVPAGITIAAGEIKLFKRTETKITLNNSDDSVRLLDPLGRIKAEYSYGATKEGYSFNWSEGGNYLVSTTPTPGAANNITAPTDVEEQDEEEEKTSTANGKVAGATVEKILLTDIREEEKGTMVEVVGTVSAPPGVLGERVVYLAGSGVQVYFSKALWPKLSLGDEVRITGEVSASGGETRLKLAQASDIAVVKTGAAPQPHVMETGEVGEETEGWLVTIQGKVTETSGDTFYVDDGSGEVRVYIKPTTKIDKPAMKKGTTVTITGVVSETSSGYRVLPRWQEDVRLGLVAGMTSFPATGGQGSGLVAAGVAVILLLLAWQKQEPLMRCYKSEILN